MTCKDCFFYKKCDYYREGLDKITNIDKHCDAFFENTTAYGLFQRLNRSGADMRGKKDD